MHWSSFQCNEIVNYALSPIISLYRWQWLTCSSLYAPCHLMHCKIYTANGFSDRSCVTFTIASMCTFRLPAFCIYVVYLSIGKCYVIQANLSIFSFSHCLLYHPLTQSKPIQHSPFTFGPKIYFSVQSPTFKLYICTLYIHTFTVCSSLWPSGEVWWSVQ